MDNNKHNFSFCSRFKFYTVKVFLSFIIILAFFQANAQLGGSKVYSFLELSNSARNTALGGTFLPVNDDDITLAYSNPALINSNMNNKLAISYLNYFSDISAGFVSYGQQFKKAGTFVASLQFVNYGNFLETDAIGNEYGNFSAGDYALIVGWSKALSPKWNLGVNLKNIYSSLDRYSSYGLAVDVASQYTSESKLFGAAFILGNMGRQISTYTSGTTEPLPFNAKLGIYKKFDHAPIRLIFLAENLQKWDLSYTDPNQDLNIDPFTGEVKTVNKVAAFADKSMRHLVAAAEFIPGNGNFSLRLGYNYRRRAELQIASRKAMVGFSWGLGLKIYKFHFSYARSSYSLAGATNSITITTNLRDFL